MGFTAAEYCQVCKANPLQSFPQSFWFSVCTVVIYFFNSVSILSLNLFLQ